MSTLDLIGRYLVERARLGVLVPLSLLLAAATLVAAPHVDVLSRAIDAAAQALVLVLAFRVWDDLEDRKRDAREHPERVMVVSRRTAPFVTLGVLFAAAGIVPILLGARSTPRLAAIAGAAAMLLVWYRLRRESSGVVGGHVVLLKYPAIAYAVAATQPPLVILASLYLVLCAYEAFDDPTLRASIIARRIAMTELALAPLIIATASLLGGGLT